MYVYIHIYRHILDMTMYVCTSLMIPSPRCSMSLSPIETLTEYAGSVSSWGPKFLIEGKLGMGQHVHPEKMVDLQKITEFGFIVLVKNAASFLTTKTNSTRCYSRMLSTFELVRPYLGLLNMYILMYVYIYKYIYIYNSCYICTNNG